MNETPLVVIDTQLLLRATINRRSLPARLFFNMREQYRLAVSLEVIAEIKDVFARPKLRQKFPSLTTATANETLEAFESGEFFAPPQILAVSRGPKDDKFLALAVEAKAQFIVSEDNDLLVLNPYQGIQIINALDFLRALEALSAQLPINDEDIP